MHHYQEHNADFSGFSNQNIGITTIYHVWEKKRKKEEKKKKEECSCVNKL